MDDRGSPRNLKRRDVIDWVSQTLVHSLDCSISNALDSSEDDCDIPTIEDRDGESEGVAIVDAEEDCSSGIDEMGDPFSDCDDCVLHVFTLCSSLPD